MINNNNIDIIELEEEDTFSNYSEQSAPKESYKSSATVLLGSKFYRVSVISEECRTLRLNHENWKEVKEAVRDVFDSNGFDKTVNSFVFNQEDGKVRFEDNTIKAIDEINFNDLSHIEGKVCKNLDENGKNPIHALFRFHDKDEKLTGRDLSYYLEALKKTYEQNFDYQFVCPNADKANKLALDLNSLDPLLIPMKIGNHFVGLYVDRTKNNISYFDSAGKSINDKERKKVKRYANDLAKKLSITKEIKDTTKKFQKDKDQTSCGRYLIDYFHNRIIGTGHKDYFAFDKIKVQGILDFSKDLTLDLLILPNNS
ncbi:MAG: Ulp1 family isopeptidase [Simkaniaceae bacterium]